MSRRPIARELAAQLDAKDLQAVQRLTRLGWHRVRSHTDDVVRQAWTSSADTRAAHAMLTAAAAVLALLAIAGELAPQRGVEDLAAELGCSRRTIRRATGWLRSQGLLLRPVRGRKGQGYNRYQLPHLLLVRLLERVAASGKASSARGLRKRRQGASTAQVVSRPPVTGSVQPGRAPGLVVNRAPGEPPDEDRPAADSQRATYLAEIRTMFRHRE